MGLSSRTLLLAGATGLVGGLALRRLLQEPGFAGTVFAPSRRFPGVEDDRLVSPIVDFFSAQADADLGAVLTRQSPGPLDAYVSCLGTTLRDAGSRAAFIAVDRELVLRLAQLAHDHGARHAIVVSSAGASRQSGNFYLRVKGEVEDALSRVGFTRLDILQPGLLIGPRRQSRPLETVAQALMPMANPLLQGRFRRYRTIEAAAVASAIVQLLRQEAPGQFSHCHDAIRSLSGAV